MYQLRLKAEVIDDYRQMDIVDVPTVELCTSTVDEKYNIDTIYSPVILDLFSALSFKKKLKKFQDNQLNIKHGANAK